MDAVLDYCSEIVSSNVIQQKGYISELERLTSEGYLDVFLETIQNRLDNNLKVINKSFPQVRFLKDELLKNKNYIKTRLTPLNPIDIYLGEGGMVKEDITLKISNSSIFPIEIVNIESQSGNYQTINQTFLPASNNFRKYYFKDLNLIKQSNKKQ